MSSTDLPSEEDKTVVLDIACMAHALGQHMNDHQQRIEPSVGATEEPMMNSLANGHRYAAGADPNPGVTLAKIIGLAALALFVLVAGWHYYHHLALESALSDNANQYLSEHLSGATAAVNVSPVSNLVSIRVERSDRASNPLVGFIEDSLIESVRQELEPKLDRQLSVNARAAMDFYAILLPYQVTIDVDQATGSAKGAWPAAMTSEFTEVCIQAIVAPARRDYYAAARRAGDSSPTDFPEQKLREFVEPVCACASKEASQKWTADEIQTVPVTQSKEYESFMSEVLAPHRCNAEGIVHQMRKEWN